MVRIAMAIEGEIVDAKSIQDADTSKRKEGQPSLSLGKRQRTSVSPRITGIGPRLSNPRSGLGISGPRLR